MSIPVSVQRSRPLDSLQRVVACFKHFEKKLDKLQADVSQHGQTLDDLRLLMTNLTGNSIAPDIKRFEDRRLKKKSTAIQYDGSSGFEIKKTKRKSAQPVNSKGKSKSYPYHKGSRICQTGSPTGLSKYPSSPTDLIKASPRPRKAEAPRKTTTIRAQHIIEKKRTKTAS